MHSLMVVEKGQNVPFGVFFLSKSQILRWSNKTYKTKLIGKMGRTNKISPTVCLFFFSALCNTHNGCLPLHLSPSVFRFS